MKQYVESNEAAKVTAARYVICKNVIFFGYQQNLVVFLIEKN